MSSTASTPELLKLADALDLVQWCSTPEHPHPQCHVNRGFHDKIQAMAKKKPVQYATVVKAYIKHIVEEEVEPSMRKRINVWCLLGLVFQYPAVLACRDCLHFFNRVSMFLDKQKPWFTAAAFYEAKQSDLAANHLKQARRELRALYKNHLSKSH
jgi:hypothetical protein